MGVLKEKIHFDSPLFFDVDEILMYIKNRNNEKKDKNNNIPYKTADGETHNYDAVSVGLKSPFRVGLI